MQNHGTVADTDFRSNGGRLVSTDGKELPLRAVEIGAEAAGGLASTELRQIFRNPYEEPLELTYKFPLPARGAVAGYEIRVGERVIRGEIDRRGAARERYEQALVEGRTAALLDQERANLFTQNVGNVPPGVEVTVVLTVDQPLAWLAEGMWEWRFPTAAAPRYLGAEGRVPDAEEVTLDVNHGRSGIEATFELAIGDEISESEPTSPSHAIRAEHSRVRLEAEGAALDRDIVVRWTVARPRPGLSLLRARPTEGAPHAGSAYGLLTLVPPLAPEVTLARDLIVLLDVSGSMRGEPIGRAKQLVIRLIESLGEIDRLEMIAFADRPVRWRPDPATASFEVRQSAIRWVEELSAGGATEMVSAIRQALEPTRADAQRQVIVVTDGLIGFESQAIKAIRDRLPEGSRLHTVGVGSATNTAFLHSAARAGRGVEVIVGLDDELQKSSSRIVAATQGPSVVDVEIAGSAVEQRAPQRSVDLMAASPVLQGVRLRPEGGELTVRGRSPEGDWEQSINVPPTPHGEGVAAVIALFGREVVEDLELDLACGADRANVDKEVEKIGLEFGLATRLTSWLAVSEEPAVDPREPVRVERVPQELPYGMSAEGVGLARAAGGFELSLADFSMDHGLDARFAGAKVAALRQGRRGVFDLLGATKSMRLPGPTGLASIIVNFVDGLIGRFGRIIESLDQDNADLSFKVNRVHRELLALRRAVDGTDTGDEATTNAIRRARGALRSLELHIAHDDEHRDLRDRLAPSMNALLDQIDRDSRTGFAGPPCLKLQGRVLPARNRQSSIVEFLTPQVLDWQASGFAITRKGPEVQIAMVSSRKTTRTGRVKQGRRVRLELEVAPDAMVGVVEVSLYSEKAVMIIELKDRI